MRQQHEISARRASVRRGSQCLACSLLVVLAGCVSGQTPAAGEPGGEFGDRETADSWSEPEPEAPEPQAPGRLEDCWGPGRTIGLLTGTWASKDRNLAVNVPLASWYIREEDRKGYGILGGALAYDTVSVERVQGRPVTKSLWSHGLLGLFGRGEKRDLEGGGGYAKYHWCFPFYRFANNNGERTVYPLFLFPMSLKPDPRPMLQVPPWDETVTGVSMIGDPIDPPEIDLPPAPPPGEITMRPAPPRNPRTPDSSLQSMSDLLKQSRTERNQRAMERTPTGTRTAQPVYSSGRTVARAEAGKESSTARPARTRARADRNTATGNWRSTATPTATPARTPARNVAPAATARSYRVRPGDTLSSIARREYGSASQWRTIHEANRGKLPNPDRLSEGLLLTIPAR